MPEVLGHETQSYVSATCSSSGFFEPRESEAKTKQPDTRS